MTDLRGVGGSVRPRCVVVGAGIVGVCSALSLQQAGADVTLIDHVPSGSGCSFGNGGLIQTGACIPLATPAVLRRLPSLLLQPTGPLVIRWRRLLAMRQFLLRFVEAAGQVEAISTALADMLRQASSSYETLLNAADLRGLVRTSGEMYVYETLSGFESAKPIHELRRRHGVRVYFLSGDEARALEPALGRTVTGAALLPDTQAATDPYLLTSRLASHFARLGGRFESARVTDVHVVGANHVEITTTMQTMRPDIVVVAAGAESGTFARRLGLRVPLQPERGYHLMLKGADELNTPIVGGEYRFGLIRQLTGVRLVAGSELAAVDDAPDFRRINRLVTVARRLVPSLEGTVERRWMGARPSMPDSLPVIMRSPASRRVIFAFGHGHLGLTLGAHTGQLVANLAMTDAIPPGYVTWPRRFEVNSSPHASAAYISPQP